MNICYSLKVLLLNTIFVHLSILEDEGCLSWIEKHVYDNSKLHSIMGPSILIKFEDFEELQNISCPNDKLKTDTIILFPNRNIMIDSDIDLVKKLSFIKRTCFTWNQNCHFFKASRSTRRKLYGILGRKSRNEIHKELDSCSTITN